MTRQWYAGLLIVCLGSLAGCEHRPAPARMDTLAPKHYPQITALEGLDSVVVVNEVVVTQGPPLKVSVSVRNDDDTERSVQYRFFFVDRENLPETSDTDWHFLKLPARTLVYLKGNAIDKKAVDWRLEIRPAR